MANTIEQIRNRLNPSPSSSDRSIEQIRARLNPDPSERSILDIMTRLGRNLGTDSLALKTGTLDERRIAAGVPVEKDVAPTVPPLSEFTMFSTRVPTGEPPPPTLDEQRVAAGIPIEKDVLPETVGQTLHEDFKPTLAFLGSPITIPANIIVGTINEIKGKDSFRNKNAIKRILALDPVEGDELFVSDILKSLGITDKRARLPEGTIDKLGLVGDFAAFGGADKVVRAIAKSATAKIPAVTFGKEMKKRLAENVGLADAREKLRKGVLEPDAGITETEKLIRGVKESQVESRLFENKRVNLAKGTGEPFRPVLKNDSKPVFAEGFKSVEETENAITKLYKNVIPEKGIGTGKAFKPTLESGKVFIPETIGNINKEKISFAINEKDAIFATRKKMGEMLNAIGQKVKEKGLKGLDAQDFADTTLRRFAVSNPTPELTSLREKMLREHIQRGGTVMRASVKKIFDKKGNLVKIDIGFKPVPNLKEAVVSKQEQILASTIQERGAGFNPFNLIPETVKTKAKEFWKPFSTLPKTEETLARRSRGRGDVAKAEAFIGKLKKRIDAHPIEVRKEIFKFLDGTIDISDLPTNARVLAQSIRSAQNRIGKALVERGLLPEEAFETLKGRYVHYIYARDILGKGADIDPARIITPTGKLDMSYLKSRNKNLAAIDRQALGLIEDSGVAVPVGMGKALTDIAKFDYLSELTNPALDIVWQPSVVKVGNKSWGISKLANEVDRQSRLVANNAKSGIGNQPAIERLTRLSTALEEAKIATQKAPEGFRQIPNGAKFGNMAGAFVRKPVFDDIMPIVNPLSSDAGVGEMLGTFLNFNAQVTGLFKAGKVALNPPTMFRNSVSNILQNNMRGRNISLIPIDFASAVKSAIKKDSHWITAKRNGLFESNWSVGELNEVLKNINQVNPNKWNTFLDFVGKISKFYGKIDDMAKFTIYKQLRKSGKLNRFGVATGKKATVDEAILEAQKWGMDYSLASRSIKGLRRQILPFGTYQYKIAPLIAESLAKRPWVIGKYQALLGIGGFSLSQELVKNYFDVTDEQWERLLKLLPDYIKRNQTFAPLPWKSPEGQWQWVNGEYFMPWGTWSTILRDVTQKEGFEAFKSIGFGNPIISVFQAINSGTRDKPPVDPFTKQPIWNQLDSPQEKYLKLASWLSNQVMPSVFENIGVQDASRQGAIGTTARVLESKITGEPFKDKWGRTLTLDQSIGKWFGFNITTISPKQTKIIKFAKQKELRKSLFKILLDPRISREKKIKAKKRFFKEVKNINK